MITLSPIFSEANSESAKQGDVLVAIEDVTLFDLKETAADWEANTSESNVDYFSQQGNTILRLPFWVTDSITDKIYNIGANGDLISSFATSVYDAAAIGPNGITEATDDTLWVTDVVTAKTYNIEKDGTWISEFDAVDYDGASDDPWGIVYATDDTLWIADVNTEKFYNVELDGTLISSFTATTFDVAATSPRGITEASDGTLWVTDSVTGKVYNVETDGTWISEFHKDDFDSSATGVTNVSYSLDDTLWLVNGNTDKVYNVKVNGSLINFFLADDFDVAANAIGGVSSPLAYPASGNVTTNNFDLGVVPTDAGEWAIVDIKPGDSTITYSAEYSTTGAWGGEEVSIGAIEDGDGITVLARYWRVTATLSANTSGSDTPVLQSIKADYTTFKKFNKIKDLGYEAVVGDISSLTSNVDFFEPTSIGTISVGIALTDSVSDWVYGDTLFNKIVRVKIGYNYPGFVESDYLSFFTGAIDDWDVRDNILTLSLKDLSKDWKLPVPSKWETIADDVEYINQHHIDVILDIFQNEINVRDSGLLLDFFETVKTATPGYKVTRTITKKTEDAKKLVEELRFLLWAYYLPRGDGKIGLKQFDKTEAIQTTFTDDNTVSIEWEANSESLINRTALYFNHDGSSEEDEENFSELDEGDDTTSQTDFRAIVPFKLLDKWTRAAEASQISDLEAKILEQFDTMPARVRITCDVNQIAIEAGDMVNVTTVNAPGSGGAGITDEKYLLTSKNLDFLGDTIIFEGLRVVV